jgi:hypothetical protein
MFFRLCVETRQSIRLVRKHGKRLAERAHQGELLRFLFCRGGLAAHHFELFDDGVGQMRFDLAAQVCGARVEYGGVAASGK